jgi:YebC/PmpR family DNA-binding regulatory protein
MSGHSKWATIKHKKAATDAKRGQAFTKIIKEITVAARIGGGDPGGNPRLRTVLEKAKAVNMPADNIKRAIQKGTGELPGQVIEEVTFEGYGPGGVAVIVETATDNRNRTVGDVRHLFDKYGGNLGQNGCVAWMFDKKGVIEVDAAKATEEQLMEIALDAGADDIAAADDTFEITTPVVAFETVRQALEARGVPISLAEITIDRKSVV